MNPIRSSQREVMNGLSFFDSLSVGVSVSDERDTGLAIIAGFDAAPRIRGAVDSASVPGMCAG